MRKIAETIRSFAANPLTGAVVVVLWCGAVLGTIAYYSRHC